MYQSDCLQTALRSTGGAFPFEKSVALRVEATCFVWKTAGRREYVQKVCSTN